MLLNCCRCLSSFMLLYVGPHHNLFAVLLFQQHHTLKFLFLTSIRFPRVSVSPSVLHFYQRPVSTGHHN